MLNPLGRFDWERLVRRVDMPPTTKLVALMLATYSNRRGGNAHPGNKRLALDCGVSDRTVERHLDWLRDKGLVERVFRGSAAGRSRHADTYQLVVADDLPNRVQFTGTPDATDGCSTEIEAVSPDTGDGSSVRPTHETPVTTVASFFAELPTFGEEHPTPVTGTPDKFAGTPDTHVAPSSSYINHYQEEHHHSADSTAAHARDDDEDLPEDAGEPLTQTDIELAALRSLGTDRCSALLDAANADVSDDGFNWSRLVHAAYERSGLQGVA